MKRILFLLLVCGTMFSSSAQTTRTTTTYRHSHRHYYYYPSSNVYFDEGSGNYWYWDNGSSQWSMAQTLPTTIVVEKTPRYMLRYNGGDPWKNNDADRIKYKVKKNGKVKMKPKD